MSLSTAHSILIIPYYHADSVFLALRRGGQGETGESRRRTGGDFAGRAGAVWCENVRAGVKSGWAHERGYRVYLFPFQAGYIVRVCPHAEF